MKPPLSVILVSILYILAGTAGIIYHFTDPIGAEYFWLLAVRLAAVVGGVFVLRHANWARWLLVGWITFHVGLSLFHSMQEGLIHAVVLVVTVWLLFNGKAREYFSER